MHSVCTEGKIQCIRPHIITLGVLSTARYSNVYAGEDSTVQVCNDVKLLQISAKHEFQCFIVSVPVGTLLSGSESPIYRGPGGHFLQKCVSIYRQETELWLPTNSDLTIVDKIKIFLSVSVGKLSTLIS